MSNLDLRNTWRRQQQFTGTDHAGIRLQNLTTTLRNALATDNAADAAQAGHIIWNTTTSVLNYYDGSNWQALGPSGGEVFTGNISFSGTTIAGLTLNSLTTTQRDALTGAAGQLIWNTTTTVPNVFDGSAWQAVGLLDTAQTWSKQNIHTVARSITSATAAALDDLKVAAATTTITGNTGSPITALAKVGLYRPTFTDASAVTVTDAATFYIDNAPLAAGSVTITNPWALLVGTGASKFGGTIQATAFNIGADTFLNRTAAASWQLGAADVDTNAAIVAQTLRSQGTLAGGTSDQAGKDWTYIASPGKGTGAGGKHIFQTAPAGSTGTTVNTLVAALTLGASAAWVQPGTGTAALAPLQFTSGINLTTPAAGAVEFDGVQLYKTIDTTSGRGAIPVEQYFHLTSAGSTISTIANYFGATSNISLVASAYYVIDVYAWFLNTTSGTVVWTLTNSAAPTSQNIYYEMSPATGIVAPPGTATMLIGQVRNDATATLALTATAALTDAVSHYMHMRIYLQNGTGTSLKIQATKSAGTITPGINSYWVARRMSPSNIGTFAA